MHHPRLVLASVVLGLVTTGAVHAQSFPTEDPVIKQMWAEGMDDSQAYALAQALTDSIGPRLTASPGHRAANEWLVARYESWGIDARNEEYSKWMSWSRGVTHIDLVEPRVRTLSGMLLAWSPGTDGTSRGEVITLPAVADSADFADWLPNVKGKFVLTSLPESTCRPDDDWSQWATRESFQAMQAVRELAEAAYAENLERTGYTRNELPGALADAGARGLVSSSWPGGWGARRIFRARTRRIPSFDLSCEDYGLVYRLADNGQGPALELEADADFEGEVPVFNTIAEIRGTEKPDEYIVLSAHLDSWDGASGATDNATGTITVLEAMRILKAAYPNPKRTIIAGLWGGEEQGLNGSRAFTAQHPEVVEGLQALFNQDNGTGRTVQISMQGLTEAGGHFGRWIASVPTELTDHITLNVPGRPGGGGSDYASFVCHGAPGFSLRALSWSYNPYTWHTNLDTFDKIVMDDLKNNATLFAMLTYMASEDSASVAREQRVLPISQRTGEQMTWPECREPRTWEAYSR